MASIYTVDGEEITVGLQGCNVCDAAIHAAYAAAERLGSNVVLHDDDGQWLITPDGDYSPMWTHRIEEAGAGFPDDGDEVIADGRLMVIARTSGIQTAQWRANWIDCVLIPADRDIDDLTDAEYDDMPVATAI